MKTKFTFITLIFIFNINYSQAKSIPFNKDTIELKFNNSKADSIIRNINTSIIDGKNIILIKSENKDQKTTFGDKLLDSINVLLGVLIGAIITFGISIINEIRNRRKTQKRYLRLLERYISFLSVQERSIDKDENYKLLFPISGEYAEVIIEKEKTTKLFETIDAIGQFDKTQNAAQFRMEIKRIWNIS